MSIRVIIERQTIPGCELQLNDVLIEMRSLATQAKGYISGETLRSVDDPSSYIVISTWSTVEDWKAWASSEKRKEMQLRIDRLLQRPSTHRVYTHGD